MSLLGWLGKLFGYAASPAGAQVLDEVATEARDFLDTLQDGARPVPLPHAAVEHQRAQAASAAHAFPPPCPASLPPSAPPSKAPPRDSTNPEQAWHQASVDYPPVSLPATPLPLRALPPRPSSGPPPRMSPPPPLPPPPARPGVARPPLRKR